MRAPGTQDPIDALLRAIEAQESGGDPDARNRRTGAYGRFQIMPSNWEPWSKEVFGEVVERTPENQERITRHKIGQYVDRFGVDGALVAWYGGPRRAREWVENPDNPWFDRKHGGGNEPSVREYVGSVMGRMRSAQTEPRVNAAEPFQITDPMSTENFAPRQSAAPAQAAPDRIGLLSTALRNAHSAGDTAAAQRFAQEIVRLRGSEGPPQQADASPTAPTPRERGRQSAEGAGFVAAAGQGAGSGLFGVGTPLTAAEAMIGSRLKGEPMSWDDALEYARGRREGMAEEAPGAYYTGFGASMVGGIRAGAKAVSKLPGVVQRIITPTRAAEGAGRAARAGNAAANLARVSGTGATAAGVTALNEEGVDAVPGAAGTGAIAAPLMVAGGSGVLKAGGAVRDRYGGNGAMQIIANRLQAPIEVVQENFDRWKRAYGEQGRGPRLAEVLDPRSAEEMALIANSGVGAGAGRVFREAAADASQTRQFELADAIGSGGRTTSVADETNRLAPIQREAAEETGRRVQTSERAVAGRATARFKDVMKKPGEGGLGDHNVTVTDDMLTKLMEPDIQGSIPTIVRRRLNEQLAAGEDAGSINLSMHMWDRLRKSLGKRAKGTDAPEIYSSLRDDVTSYVTERVPEYRRLLEEYGRRREVAAGIPIGRAALTQDVREFAGMLDTAGGGAPGRPVRPRQAAMTEVGARIGARTNFANMLRENPERTMEALSRDGNMMQNLRRVLQPEEVTRLEELAERYGHSLRRVEGAQVGAQGVNVGSGSPEGFAAEARAVRATPEGGAALEQGARGMLVNAVGKPQQAAAVAEAMAEHKNLPERLATAFGAEEAGRLREVGQAATLARRNLDSMTPAGTEASQRAAAQSQDVQTIIGALVITTGRASGAMQAGVGARLVARFKMTPRGAERAAQLLMDPEEAPRIIAYLRARGAKADEIHKMYMEAAAAAGIMTGSAAEGGGGGR